MTTPDNPNSKPTLAECRAIIDAAPLQVLVEIVDALRVMRDQPAAQEIDDDHHQRRPQAGWWRRRQRGRPSRRRM